MRTSLLRALVSNHVHAEPTWRLLSLSSLLLSSSAAGGFRPQAQVAEEALRVLDQAQALQVRRRLHGGALVGPRQVAWGCSSLQQGLMFGSAAAQTQDKHPYIAHVPIHYRFPQLVPPCYCHLA